MALQKRPDGDIPILTMQKVIASLGLTSPESELKVAAYRTRITKFQGTVWTPIFSGIFGSARNAILL